MLQNPQKWRGFQDLALTYFSSFICHPSIGPQSLAVANFLPSPRRPCCLIYCFCLPIWCSLWLECLLPSFSCINSFSSFKTQPKRWAFWKHFSVLAGTIICFLRFTVPFYYEYFLNCIVTLSKSLSSSCLSAFSDALLIDSELLKSEHWPLTCHHLCILRTRYSLV